MAGCCVAETAPAVTLAWMRQLGAAGGDSSRSVAIDVDGNVLVTGAFSDTVDFGATSLTAEMTDGFVVKFDAGGTVLWASKLGGPGIDLGRSVEATDDGDLLVAGRYSDGADLGCGVVAPTGGYAGFLARYAGSDGSCVWSREFLVNGWIDLDSSSAAGAVMTGGVSVPARTSLWLARYDLDGVATWSRSFGGAGTNSGYRVSAGGNRISVLGTARGETDFDGTLVSFGDAGSIVVESFDLAGNYVWSRPLWSPSGTSAQGTVAVDSAGATIVTSGFEGSLDLGSGVVTSSGHDGFIAKYGPDGQHVWSHVFTATGIAWGAVLHIDPLGDIKLIGAYEGILDLGDGALREASLLNVFLAKYASDGRLVWSMDFGGELYNCVESVAFGDRSMAFAGTLAGTKRCGGQDRTSEGEFDAMVGMYRLE